MSRLIFVLLDGLRHDVACQTMGFMHAQSVAASCPCLTVRAELPSLSRPLYETLMTGVPPISSGIIGNTVARRSQHASIFDRCRAVGKVTAAAAYHWFSELYNEAPFHSRSRLTNDPKLAIQHGLFYWTDSYPDDHLFADAEALRRTYEPDFLLVHSMGIDDSGHRHGGASPGYRAAVRRADALLATHLPKWLEDGYIVVVTSDHGMSDDGKHGGPGEDETTVPFWLFVGGCSYGDLHLQQTEIAGTVCALLGVAHSDMKANEALLQNVHIPGR